MVWLHHSDHFRVSNKLLIILLSSNFLKLNAISQFSYLIIFSHLHFCAVKYVNPITNMCIIRASREEYEKVWASITMVRSIGHYPVVFNLLDLSGKSKYCMIGIICLFLFSIDAFMIVFEYQTRGVLDSIFIRSLFYFSNTKSCYINLSKNKVLL
jgi:hypothetical protein